MPEDTFSEEESVRCPPGREKGLWNAEVHQTAGTGSTAETVMAPRQGGAADRLLASVWELQCQRAWFWHSGPCNWGARVPPSVQGKYPSLLDSQLPLRQGLGSLAGPVPFPPLSTPGELISHQCVAVVLTGLEMTQSGLQSHVCCSGPGRCASYVISLILVTIPVRMGIITLGPS